MAGPREVQAERVDRGSLTHWQWLIVAGLVTLVAVLPIIALLPADDGGALTPTAITGFAPPRELEVAIGEAAVDDLRVPTGGRVVARGPAGLVIELEGPGELLAQPADGVRVALSSGRLRVDAPGVDARRLVIEAGRATVDAMGSRLFVQHWAGEPVRVGVARGVARVRKAETEVVVEAGQVWTSRRGTMSLTATEAQDLASMEVLLEASASPASR